MIVVLPVCGKDKEAALRNLRWLVSFKKPCRLTCIVSHDDSAGDLSDVVTLARNFFAEVRDHTYNHPAIADWPMGANWAFRQASARIYTQEKQPWLWWEQDAVPLVSDTFDLISDEYASCGKPFLGTPSHVTGGRHLSGVAVYPPDLPRRCPEMLMAGRQAFDVVGGSVVLNQSSHTPLIQHVWSRSRLDPAAPALTFTDQQSLEIIDQQAVLFHRCKDGSLIAALQAKPNGTRNHTFLERCRNKVVAHLRKNWNTKRARVIHVVERHPSDEPRIKRAVKSWKDLYLKGEAEPFEVWKYPRSSVDIGDTRCLPYLKDLLLLSMQEAGRDDIIMFTNGDNILHPELPGLLRETLEKVPCICSFRMNVKECPDLTATPQQLLNVGEPDFGRDLFAFRKSWLLKNWNEIPDFFIGEWEWDLVMALMIRFENGVVTETKNNLHDHNDQSELPLGYVFHELHERPWLSTKYHSSPAKKHNLDAANSWYAKHNLESFTLHP